MPNGPVVLIILDGFGINPKKEGNAIALAHAPTIRKLEKGNASCVLTSGEAVGLPKGQMGNSEVGHMNIGSGRIVYQDFTRINKAIQDETFFQNAVLEKVCEKAKKNNAKCHLLGLVSDGGVHSHIEHLQAVIKYLNQKGFERTFIHAFLDGRDVAYKSSPTYIKQLEGAPIATISGRYYAMDRDKRWDRLQKTYDALVHAKGLSAPSPLAAIEAAFSRGETDEFVKPTVIDPNGKIEPNDVVLFFNFRADRARQLTRALTEPSFSEFNRGGALALSYFATMTQYHKNFSHPVLFPPLELTHILGEELASREMAQLRVAETEKYAHVTFFFNSGKETVFPGEERILVPSPRDVATYDLKPEMNASGVTETLTSHIQKNKARFIVANYANADMVGHSGNLKAAIKAVETIDQSLEKIIQAIQKQNGELIITADHGNVEQMIDYDTGHPHTAHTTGPVPVYYVGSQKKASLQNGILADIAPTLLDIMNIPQPKEMTGKSLFSHS